MEVGESTGIWFQVCKRLVEHWTITSPSRCHAPPFHRCVAWCEVHSSESQQQLQHWCRAREVSGWWYGRAQRSAYARHVFSPAREYPALLSYPLLPTRKHTIWVWLPHFSATNVHPGLVNPVRISMDVLLITSCTNAESWLKEQPVQDNSLRIHGPNLW